MNKFKPFIFTATGALMLVCYTVLDRIYGVEVSFSKYALCVMVIIFGVYLNSNQK
jgi:hypothetical protein